MPTTTAEETIECPDSYKQSHPTFFKVIRQGAPGEYSSKLVTERAFPKDSVVANLEGLTPGEKRYTSVQVSETKHIELNSDLVYMNHSCEPSVILDIDRMSVIAVKDLAEGDELTFFYPSTEWDMIQPFSCWCGSPKCIKTVQGAKHLSTETLKQFCLSKHIAQYLEKRNTSA
ncbi:hypothetical protein BY458DRAFT_455442 [Sporodiniella umbellata]|nr:hypothetical protein BY458DRAFT_455442 [Sporodiniella umbellata]